MGRTTRATWTTDYEFGGDIVYAIAEGDGWIGCEDVGDEGSWGGWVEAGRGAKVSHGEPAS